MGKQVQTVENHLNLNSNSETPTTHHYLPMLTMHQERENISLDELLKDCDPAILTNTVVDNMIKMHAIYRRNYKKIVVSVSGGSDSDIVIDLCKRLDPYSINTIYIWMNTGLEYQATKEHLAYLEERYGITIHRLPAKMPIPLAIKKYGQPCFSKQVSEFIHRLQVHGFQWEDEPFEVLIRKYPHCNSALRWWCNEKGEGSCFGINRNKWLKEFLISNPPTFAISNMCCKKSKKETMLDMYKEINPDLEIVGIRKYEGGARGAISSCFSSNADHEYDTYRPVFWYKQEDKTAYEQNFNICHSRCYTDYGLKRTGCVGCPFGRDFEKELEACDRFEPALAKACRNIFRDSYEYMRQYKEFCNVMDKRKKAGQPVIIHTPKQKISSKPIPVQMTIWDLLKELDDVG